LFLEQQRHSSSFSSKCKFCKMIIIREKNLKKHIRNYHQRGPMQCDACDYKSHNRNLMLEHTKTHLRRIFRRKFKCSTCDAEFLNRRQRIDHENRHHKIQESSYKCDECCKSYSDRQKYKQHLKYHNLPSVLCSVCKRVYTDKYCLRRHVKQSHPVEFKTLYTTKAINEPKWLQNGVENIKVPERIRKIKAKPPQKPRPPKPTERHFCDICGNTYLRKQTMQKHIAKHLLTTLKISFNCKFCNHKLLTPESLDYHVKNYHAPKRFECDLCDVKHATKTKIAKHLVYSHKERNIFCEICDSAQATASELRNHIKLIHDKAFQKICEVCGSSFRNDTLLRAHKQRKHEEKRFACSFDGCDKKYSFQRGLLLHIKTHTNEKDYVCDRKGCTKAYTVKNQLLRHIGLTHDKVRDNCPVEDCNHSTGRFDYMRAHLRKHSLAKEQEDHYLKVIKAMKLV